MPSTPAQLAVAMVFVHFDKISEKSAQVYVETEIQNDNTRSESVTIETTLTDAEGNVIKRTSGKLSELRRKEINPPADGSEESETLVTGCSLSI